jgi:hypothetical protein
MRSKGAPNRHQAGLWLAAAPERGRHDGDTRASYSWVTGMIRFRPIRLARLAFLLSIVATLLVPASRTAAGQVREYEAFYAFGDSLADTGNVLIATTQRGFTPTIPPSASPNRAYYNGRFSNRPIVFEYLWELLSRRGDESSIGLPPSLALPSVPLQGGVSSRSAEPAPAMSMSRLASFPCRA